MTANNLIWIRETPTDLQSPYRRPQYVRRSHKKSRQGCLVCKARRVKCDEQKPSCSQCRYRATECNYYRKPAKNEAEVEINKAKAFSENDTYVSTSELSAEACMGLHAFATSISRAVNKRASAGLSSNSLAYILNHFEQTAYSTISSPVGQRILHDKIPSMLMSQPVLLHTVLAFSSSHLEYLSRNTPDRGSLLLAATYHTQRALSLYSDRIKLHQSDVNHDLMKRPSSRQEMDGLFAACILLTSLFYHVNEIDLPHRSWTVSLLDPRDQLIGRHEPSIDWITNTSGLTILLQLRQFREKVPQSIWLPFMMEATRVTGMRDPNEARQPSTPNSSSVQSRPTPESTPSYLNTPNPSPENKNSSQIQNFHAQSSPPLPPSTSTLPDIPLTSSP